MQLVASVTFDQDWWTSVFVAGLIVSIAAAYLKDGFTLLGKKLVTLITVEGKKRRRDRARMMILLAYNPTLLLAKLNSASAGMNQALGVMFMIVFVLPISVHTMRQHPEWTFGFHPPGGFDPMRYYRWILVVALLVGFALWYSYYDEIGIARRAAWHEAEKKSRIKRDRVNFQCGKPLRPRGKV